MDLQLIVITTFFISFALMKALGICASPGTGLSFFFRSPVFAPFSEKRALKKNEASIIRLKDRFLILSIANVAAVEIYQLVFTNYEITLAMKAWLFAPFIYLFTNLLGVSAQCLGLLTKEIPADIHNQPYLSKSLSEFWGRRWNIWVSDWLAVISRKWAPKDQSFRTFFAFLFSGIFHEVIVALPYYIYSGKSYFGYMSLFFMIQFLATALDKKVISQTNPSFRRAFLWSAILIPMPLFNNPSTLAFFGF